MGAEETPQPGQILMMPSDDDVQGCWKELAMRLIKCTLKIQFISAAENKCRNR